MSEVEIEMLRCLMSGPPQPQQVKEPRKDPFFFWAESDFKR
jgi:hypothetical protein